VWLLLAMAVTLVLFDTLTRQIFTFEGLVRGAVAAGPLLAAAALMTVAPRQRLVALSALGFAATPTLQLVRLVFSTDIHDLLRMPQPTYADLSQAVQLALGVIGGLSWLFSLAAVLCLAFYVGTVQTQRGWWIVGIGVALAAVQVVINVATFLPVWSMFADAPPESGFDPVRQLAGIMLGSLVFIAWAYLTAASFDRRLKVLALAGAVRLFESAVSLLGFAAFQAFPPDTTDGSQIVNSVWSGAFFLLGVAFWVAFIAGILFELPTEKTRPTHALAPAEAVATGG
jgi:hypothetical protein